MLSFKFASVLILLAVAWCVTCVPVSVADKCVARFHASLNETLTLKRTCPEASFQDCCKLAQSYRILYNSSESGVYTIDNVCEKVENTIFLSKALPPMKARCDVTTDGGGWLVLARRTPDGERVNFDRTWSEYEEGFGDLNTEFWYGLKNMHCLTSGEPMQVRFDLKTTANVSTTWTYNKFVVDGSDKQYTLHIGEPQQTGADYFIHHNNMKFSTHDNDNDFLPSSCSVQFDKSGWWYNSCYRAVLTFKRGFKTGTISGGAGPILYAYAEMKIRPLSCQLLINTPEQCS